MLSNPPLSQRDLNQLQVARQKLQSSDSPDLLKKVAYLRISCSVIEKLQPHLPGERAGLSYYTWLMQALAACDPQWWQTCQVNDRGHLTSSNLKIEQLLRPIKSFAFDFEMTLAA
jgi:hypothetical protein